MLNYDEISFIIWHKKNNQTSFNLRQFLGRFWNQLKSLVFKKTRDLDFRNRSLESWNFRLQKAPLFCDLKLKPCPKIYLPSFRLKVSLQIWNFNDWKRTSISYASFFTSWHLWLILWKLVLFLHSTKKILSFLLHLKNWKIIKN